MFVVDPEPTTAAFVAFQQQMDIAIKKHDYYRANEMFQRGFIDGWYKHSIRSKYLKAPAYKAGLDAGKEDGKKQRLINLLEKGQK